VIEEVRELRRRGAAVVPCSSRRVKPSALPTGLRALASETLFLQPLRCKTLVGALVLCVANFSAISGLVGELLLTSKESPMRWVKGLAHTFLGACLAFLLRDYEAEHIHVHHGYFSAWIAMVAARILRIPFSMTLHGSDLLLHASHMETKLRECAFCLTVSEFNRNHILAHYPAVDPAKIRVLRLGVEVPELNPSPQHHSHSPLLLAIGRLHSVKDHRFLLRACSVLHARGMRFRCLIVGEGTERPKLEHLIRELKLAGIVELVGHVSREDLDPYYELADLVVLTSRSEGIPLALMEAMARRKLVLAPAITGIPELVIDGRTGFLYKPGSLEDFVRHVEQICSALDILQTIRQAAREHVQIHFEQSRNLRASANLLLQKIAGHRRSFNDEDLILQQI